MRRDRRGVNDEHAMRSSGPMAGIKNFAKDAGEDGSQIRRPVAGRIQNFEIVFGFEAPAASKQNYC